MDSNQRRQRVGIFMPTWVGDAVMATPTLRCLRDAFPHAEIVGVMRPVIRDLLHGDNLFSEHLLFDKRARFARCGLIGSLRRAQLDSVVLLTNSLWTAAVVRLAGVRQSIGYARDLRGWLLSNRVTCPRPAGPVAPIATLDDYLGIAKHLGCSTTDRRTRLVVAPDEQQQAEQLWEQLGFRQTTPTVVINSASATDQLRIWPQAKVGELSKRIAEQLGYQVLLHCGPAERSLTNQLAQSLQHPLVASMGVAVDLPIGLTKAVMSQATAVITTDSGPRHIAVALDRPVVSLFGPTTPEATRTYNHPESCVQAPQGDMHQITVEQVYSALESILPMALHRHAA